MARAEPEVERNVRFPVVALEVAMVQLVEVGAGRDFPLLSDHHVLEPHMALGRGEGRVLRIQDHVDGMGRHHPVDQDAAVVQDVLNRMHGQAGPRTDIDVLVVQVVAGLVEGRPVQEPMHPVEVEQPEQRNSRQDQDEPDNLQGAGRGVQVGNDPPAVGPKHQDFVGGPRDATADAAPENVVTHLVVPQELALAGSHPVRGVLVLQPLRLLDPQPNVPGAHDDDQHHLVAEKDLQDPVPAELGRARQVRRQKVPG